MTVAIVTAPATEPVSVAEAKLFLRVDHAEEDALIASLVAAARETVEAFTARALVTRRVRESRDAWTVGVLRLALAPVSAVASVRAVRADGSFETLAGPVRTDDDRIWMAARPAPALPLAGVEIEYDAGYGAAAAVPAALRQAVLIAVAGLYESRDGDSAHLAAARTLAAPFARVRL